MLQQILTVSGFEGNLLALLATIAVALVAIYAPKWIMKMVMMLASTFLAVYAGAVLLVRIPEGIPHGSLTLMACFLFGAVWVLLWGIYFYNEWRASKPAN